jgi:hypothetical protein
VEKTRPTLPPPPPPPPYSDRAISYLKHDARGPYGDAAVVLFNPGAAQTLTVDLSVLPPGLLAAKIFPRDLFTNISADTPLAANWTVSIKAGSFAVGSWIRIDKGGFVRGLWLPSGCLCSTQGKIPALHPSRQLYHAQLVRHYSGGVFPRLCT